MKSLLILAISILPSTYSCPLLFEGSIDGKYEIVLSIESEVLFSNEVSYSTFYYYKKIGTPIELVDGGSGDKLMLKASGETFNFEKITPEHISGYWTLDGKEPLPFELSQQPIITPIEGGSRSYSLKTYVEEDEFFVSAVWDDHEILLFKEGASYCTDYPNLKGGVNVVEYETEYGTMAEFLWFAEHPWPGSAGAGGSVIVHPLNTGELIYSNYQGISESISTFSTQACDYSFNVNLLKTCVLTKHGSINEELSYIMEEKSQTAIKIGEMKFIEGEVRHYFRHLIQDRTERQRQIELVEWTLEENEN